MLASTEIGAVDRETFAPVSWTGLRVHLIGVGGCGMRAAAAVLQQWGARISGSDAAEFRDLGALVARGAVIHLGHQPGQLPDDADLVIVSAAIAEDNPELQRAGQLSIPVLTYGELLGLLLSDRTGVAVAGTHGKSTTAALTAYMYGLAGLDPSFIVGARSRQLGGNGDVGNGPHLIVESCEYARSFLHQHPHLAAILNIEREHLDCYADLGEIVDAFAAFAGNVSADGVIVARHADPTVAAAVERGAAAVETFGFEADACWQAADVQIENGRYRFVVRHRGEPLFETAMLLAGRHNVLNALAACALAFHGGAEVGSIADAIATFEGIERRMEVRGTSAGVTVIDDYAHHPTEVAVTLQAVRDRYRQRRTWVVFQPHQHSRTRLLMDEFAGCFDGAYRVLVPDVYAARDSAEEKALTGSKGLVSRLRANGLEARYLPTLEEVAAHLASELAAGDVVVTMGAGDVWKVADALVERV